jgi:hypothetical protein
VDLSRLTTGQKIAGGAGIALIINLFLPWYSVSFGSLGSASANAFDAGFLAWAGSFFAIAGAVILVLKGMGTTVAKAGSLETEHVALVVAVIGTIFIILRWLTESSFTSFGLFLGMIAAAVVAYGAYASSKEAGLSMPSVDDFKSIAGGGDDSPDEGSGSE